MNRAFQFVYFVLGLGSWDERRVEVSCEMIGVGGGGFEEGTGSDGGFKFRGSLGAGGRIAGGGLPEVAARRLNGVDVAGVLAN